MKSGVNRRVVLAEDDADISFLIEEHLLREGYEVFTTADGAEAINLIASYRPRVALLDIMMPDVDGYEICKEVQSNDWSKHIKIIFLSAKSKEADIQKGIELGAVSYITKPFSSKQLLAEVQQHLSK